MSVVPDTRVIPVPELLGVLTAMGGSDLHLMAGSPPFVRIHGELVRLDQYPTLPPQTVREMVYAILPQKLRERFEEQLELDTSYSVPGIARFRVNVYLQRDSVGATFRSIPTVIKSVDELGLPPAVAELARLQRGFVVVTGPTGSGKSTTLAAMVNVVNEERAAHVMTVEDPIEFLHQNKRSAVNQREVGQDTRGFAEAAKHVLRQDPDVILVGEMRDLETISTAITAAETGHLVFATLHTQDAPQTIDRIVDVFPSEQQQQVRVQLSRHAAGRRLPAARADRRRSGTRRRGRGARRHARGTAPHPARADVADPRRDADGRRVWGCRRWTCRSRSSRSPAGSRARWRSTVATTNRNCNGCSDQPPSERGG